MDSSATREASRGAPASAGDVNGGERDYLPLPKGISEDYIDCRDSVGLTFHILECGRDDVHPKPLVLLLHGFPELAFSWRKVMPTLGSAGHHVVAVDQRGYGRTTGWTRARYEDTDLREYSLVNFAKDITALVFALGYKAVHCLIGHDFGAAVAAFCALSRPDLFTSCVLMSHPFKSFPELPQVRQLFEISQDMPVKVERDPEIYSSLANLTVPRKHYQWYNSTLPAARDWDNPEQGLGPFLRGYFHLKSADWPQNAPEPLASWTAEELAKMPGYYIMPLGSTMPQTVSIDMKDQDFEATKPWLTDEDLDVYVREWSRTGFQGALNFYRVSTDESLMRPISEQYAGAKITVPCTFISGDRDWGNHQQPGALENMRHVCTKFQGIKTIEGAGHWPQQEQPGQVVAKILDFIWRAHRPQPMSAPIVQNTFSSWSPLGLNGIVAPKTGPTPSKSRTVDSSPAIPASPLSRFSPIVSAAPSATKASPLQRQTPQDSAMAESILLNNEVYDKVMERNQKKYDEIASPTTRGNGVIK